jgi:hypothetical protein
MVSKLSRYTEILDAEYKPACLNEVIKMCDNLSQEEQRQLLHILQKYEHVFAGTLGEFNMDPTPSRQGNKTSACTTIYCS